MTQEIQEVRAWAANRWTLGTTHGIDHWDRVHENGLKLITPEVNRKVVELFAYTHDIGRLDDSYDIEHGPRSAEIIQSIRHTLLAFLSDDEFAQLQQACRLHTTTDRTGDPTIDACFDSDRLDLGRVGIKPDARKMASQKGREMANEHDY